MNFGVLIHPQILAGLARGGHGSRVLISDGNYPHSTKRGRNCEVVYLNLRPGVVGAVDVLSAVAQAVPIEAAVVMLPLESGPYAMNGEPEIWGEYKQVLVGTDCQGKLRRVERFSFYAEASEPDVCLTIATGEERIYANVLLTIGVRR